MQSTGASNAPTAITYTTSAWNASEWTLQPTSYIDPVYQITSPSTCTGSSYALAFKANADGTAKVYANGKLVDKNLAVKAGETLTRSYTVTRGTTFKVVFTPDKSYVIQNCAAYKNGYLSFSNVAATIEAGNGFKMGGTNLPGNHKLLNSFFYDNAAKGIDSNSCLDVKVYNSTSYNNEGYLRNILLPRTLSFRICISSLHVARISCVCSSL